MRKVVSGRGSGRSRWRTAFAHLTLSALVCIVVTAGVTPLAAVGSAAPGGAGLTAATTDLAVATTVSTGAGPVVQFGTVTFVADGDTIDVRIDGVAPDPGRDGTRVRMLATQAMELYQYHSDLSRVTGECHGVEAARRLKSMLFTTTGQGRRVRLTARDASSSNLGRESRFVATQDAYGTWHDVGAVLMREGQVLPSYQKVEYARNSSYRALAQSAAARGVGLWRRDFCGRGPAADLRLRVRWNADGNDAVNVNGEYVKITNRGRSTVSLAGWWVRDSGTRAAASKAASRRGYIFPKGAKVTAGASVYAHVGRRPTHPVAGHFYFGLTAPIFENVTAAPTHLGDGAYLFDPLGNLREWQQYPCVSSRAHACLS